VWWWSAAEVADARAAANVPEAAPVAVEPLGTPVLSVRRSPEVLSRDVVERNLRADLAPVIAGMGPASCLVVHAEDRQLLSASGDLPVIPASNVKLLTATAALEVLGPTVTFETQVAATVVDGVVSGDLYLIGGGDPLLSVAEYPETQTYPPFNTTPLEALADRVVLAGVRRVTGGVVGDDSRYDDERYVPTWSEDIPNREAGPIGALLVNDGRVFPRDELPGQDPAEAAAEQLMILLERRGVGIDGPPSHGLRDGAAPVIASIQSVPLTGVVEEMLTTSDDNTAESLLKEIGLAKAGVGSRTAGAAAVLELVAGWSAPTTGAVVIDGSGLDRGNVLSCDLLVGVLDHAGPQGPIHDGLAVAGTTGTLAELFVGTPAQGALRAKTGTLSGVKALTGFYPSGDGPPLVFSLVLNGERPVVDAAWPALWTELARALEAYPNGPSPADLAP
jgi:serine-type D-Ala-D-Ala carboxypeptidase/endopeptidase (penicillin-binding protein 4)